MNVDCDLWSFGTVGTQCHFIGCVCVSLDLHAPTRPLLLISFLDVIGASRGAQSTVDGFYVIHTKLTDSVECSPRQAGGRGGDRESSWQRGRGGAGGGDDRQWDVRGRGGSWGQSQGRHSRRGGQDAQHGDIMTQDSGRMSPLSTGQRQLWLCCTQSTKGSVISWKINREDLLHYVTTTSVLTGTVKAPVQTWTWQHLKQKRELLAVVFYFGVSSPINTFSPFQFNDLTMEQQKGGKQNCQLFL